MLYLKIWAFELPLRFVILQINTRVKVFLGQGEISAEVPPQATSHKPQRTWRVKRISCHLPDKFAAEYLIKTNIPIQITTKYFQSASMVYGVWCMDKVLLSKGKYLNKEILSHLIDSE